MFFFFLIHLLRMINGLQPKICTKCRYFVHNDNLVYGKCVLFPKIEYENIYQKRKEFYEFLVTGYEKPKMIKSTEYFLCSTARECEDMCGKDGRRYEERI